MATVATDAEVEVRIIEDLTTVWRVVGAALLEVTTPAAWVDVTAIATELEASKTAELLATTATEEVATEAAEETTEEVSDDPDPPTVKSTQDS